MNHICIGDSVIFNVFVAGGVWASSFPGIAQIGFSSGVVRVIAAGDTVTFTYSIPDVTWSIADTTIAGIIAPGIVKTIAPGANEMAYTITTDIPGCFETAFFFSL
jgi:hypothetical protein